mmetsp:Transcript_2047/g.13261  ORF Transcript_2047/g.13261 Transcript_2047/m.13261 type:complete len:210 (-) Transcript_2047:4750-5379(-)
MPRSQVETRTTHLPHHGKRQRHQGTRQHPSIQPSGTVHGGGRRKPDHGTGARGPRREDGPSEHRGKWHAACWTRVIRGSSGDRWRMRGAAKVSRGVLRVPGRGIHGGKRRTALRQGAGRQGQAERDQYCALAEMRIHGGRFQEHSEGVSCPLVAQRWGRAQQHPARQGVGFARIGRVCNAPSRPDSPAICGRSLCSGTKWIEDKGGQRL